MSEIKKEYYDDGSIKSIIRYEGELIDGFAEYYYPNGVLRCRAPYSMGNLVDGTVPVFSEDGSLYRLDRWENGHCKVFAGNILRGEFSMFNGNEEGETCWYNEDGSLSETYFKKDGKYHGKRRFFDAHGRMREEIPYENGVINGNRVMFQKNGKVSVCRSYVNGEIEGESKTYDSQGVLRHLVCYKNGKEDGKEIQYYSDGSVAKSCFHKEGLLHGELVSLFPDGSLHYKTRFEEGHVIDGVVEIYDDHGNVDITEFWEDNVCRHKNDNGEFVTEIPYQNGQRHGVARFYHDNGNLRALVCYNEGETIGSELRYREDGTLESITPYQDGRRNGIRRTFHPTGELFIEEPFSNNVKNGEVKIWNEEGLLTATYFLVDNSICGYHKYRYYDSKKILSENEYTNGMPNGTEKSYYESGALYSKQQFKDGMVMDGTVNILEEDGSVKDVLHWKNNVARIFYENGNLKHISHYYRELANGLFINYAEDGSIEKECYFFDGDECESYEDFLQLNFETLGEDCADFFESEDVDISQEQFTEFFADCFEKVMRLPDSDVVYENYSEITTLPSEGRLTVPQYISKIVREFVLRMRLPNDGLTEMNIADALREFVRK